jgi:phospholipid transport system substrate-binding protein
MKEHWMNRMILKLVCTVVLATAPAVTLATPAPDKVVRDATDRVLTLIQENVETYRDDKSAFYAMVHREIVPQFDIPFISRLVLARHWRGASPEQRERFQNAFTDMLIRTYADAMLEYHDAVNVEWQPLRMAEDAEDATVQSRLMRKDGPPLPVGFVMHRPDGEWKIYDIRIENVSLVTNFRGQFAQEVRTGGLDTLITKMENAQIRPEVAPGNGGAS